MRPCRLLFGVGWSEFGREAVQVERAHTVKVFFAGGRARWPEVKVVSYCWVFLARLYWIWVGIVESLSFGSVVLT